MDEWATFDSATLGEAIGFLTALIPLVAAEVPFTGLVAAADLAATEGVVFANGFAAVVGRIGATFDRAELDTAALAVRVVGGAAERGELFAGLGRVKVDCNGLAETEESGRDFLKVEGFESVGLS